MAFERHEHRSKIPLVRSIDIGTTIDQIPPSFALSSPRRSKQGSFAIFVPDVNVCTMVK
jgi:hypothetical protein